MPEINHTRIKRMAQILLAHSIETSFQFVMHCHYINLASEARKKSELESLFARCSPSHWTLNRFEAVNKNYVNEHDISGAISDGAKGCYLSHQSLIAQNLDSKSPILIIEDDVVFSEQTFTLIDKIIESIDPNVEWDIIHTDICVPTPGAMIDFFLHKRNTKDGRLSLIDLRDKTYASTAGYIVNHKSLSKVHVLLSEPRQLNMPIDIYYRSLTHSGLLKSYVAFPFITSLSSRSTETNIQADEHAYTELIWHTYRKFMWLKPDNELVSNCIQQIKKSPIDKDAIKLLDIVSGFFRTAYRSK